MKWISTETVSDSHFHPIPPTWWNTLCVLCETGPMQKHDKFPQIRRTLNVSRRATTKHAEQTVQINLDFRGSESHIESVVSATGHTLQAVCVCVCSWWGFCCCCGHTLRKDLGSSAGWKVLKQSVLDDGCCVANLWQQKRLGFFGAASFLWQMAKVA